MTIEIKPVLVYMVSDKHVYQQMVKHMIARKHAGFRLELFETAKGLFSRLQKTREDQLPDYVFAGDNSEPLRLGHFTRRDGVWVNRQLQP